MAWIAAIAGLAGSALSSSGASSAGNAAAAGAQAAAAEQEREFNIAVGLQNPQHSLGSGADALLAQLYGTPGFNNSTAPYGGTTAPQAPAGAAAYYGTPTAGGKGGGIPYGTAAYPGATPSGYGNNLVTGYGVYANGSGGYSTSPTGGATYSKPGAAPAAPGAAPASGTPNYSSFYNSPGFLFSLQQGTNSVNRGAAAGGNLYSANTLNAQDTMAQGMASTQYNNYVNQLLTMAGLGNSSNQSLTGAAVQTGANVGNSLISAGNANASGMIGSANALTNGLNKVNWSSLGGNTSAFAGNNGGSPTNGNTVGPEPVQNPSITGN